LTNTHIKKSRHKCAQKQKMLASTVQFSTTTRTSTHHPAPAENGRRPSPRKQPTAETARSSPQDPTVCQPPNRPPRPTHGQRLVSPLFLEQPHSHTQPTGPPAAEQVLGALHHQQQAAQDTRLHTTTTDGVR
jgi:hypothetical protein